MTVLLPVNLYTLNRILYFSVLQSRIYALLGLLRNQKDYCWYIEILHDARITDVVFFRREIEVIQAQTSVSLGHAQNSNIACLILVSVD